MYKVRDFIETREGLLFSVLAYSHPPFGVLSDPRAYTNQRGRRKFDSSKDALRFIEEHYPYYLSRVPSLDTHLCVVPAHSIRRHYSPRQFLATTLQRDRPKIVAKLARAVNSLSGVAIENLGVTGSYLVGAQDASSDIDIVVYGLKNYSLARRGIERGLEEGIFQGLSEGDWLAIYRKRGIDPSFYSFPEFLRHEIRKHNRAKFAGKLFDILSCRADSEVSGVFGQTTFRRLGEATVKCRVIDAHLSGDFPATYLVRGRALGHEIRTVVSFTHTYVDQVIEGEVALCRGILEKVSGETEYYRLLVGSTREAPNQFIKSLSLVDAATSSTAQGDCVNL